MRPSTYAIGTLVSGIAIMVALAVMTHYFPAQKVLEPSRSEMAGQAAQESKEASKESSKQPLDTLLRGGPLQRNLGAAVADVFLIEETGATIPEFKTREFTVRSGEVVSLTFRNQSTLGHQHNWILVNPGRAQEVVHRAMSAGPERFWIPESGDVLAYVLMTPPGSSRTILFRAPSEPGDYPFFCSFPGHFRSMNGILHVEAGQGSSA